MQCLASKYNYFGTYITILFYCSVQWKLSILFGKITIKFRQRIPLNEKGSI